MAVCRAPGCGVTMRTGMAQIEHNCTSHHNVPGVQILRTHSRTLQGAKDLIDDMNCVWKPTSWPSKGKQSQTFHCAHKAAASSLCSKLSSDLAAQIAEEAAEFTQSFQTSAHLVHERKMDKGLGAGQQPTVRVDCDCQSGAYWKLLDSKTAAGRADPFWGQYEVCAFVLHGERCSTDDTRQRVAARVQELLLKTPTITGPQVYNALSAESPALQLTVGACEAALRRARAKLPGATPPAPTNVRVLAALAHLHPATSTAFT